MQAVIVQAPPVWPFGEVVKGLNAASIKKWRVGFIEVRQRPPCAFVRHNIAMQVEANPQMFGELIDAVQHGHLAAAMDTQDAASALAHGLQAIRLRSQARIDGQKDHIGTAGRLRGDAQQFAGAQPDVSLDLARRQANGGRGEFPFDDHGRWFARVRNPERKPQHGHAQQNRPWADPTT